MDNIFKYYATSELSNDAFLCWLFSASKDKYSSYNSVEYNVSQGYLKKFCKYDGKIIVYDNGIVKQEKNIDVLIKGKYDNGEEFILTIENKTFSKQHSDQLKRYKEYINEKYKHIKHRHFIYYKTAIQGNIDEIKNEDYLPFQLYEIYDLLNKYEAGKSTNNILKYYFDFIKEEVELFDKFKIFNINDWDDYAYQGFFYHLSKVLKNENITSIGFDHHDNRDGGKWSIWFLNDKIIKNKYGKDIGFHLNLETSSKNDKNKKWLCRLIIRANGKSNNTKWNKKDIEQFIGKIGERTNNSPGKNIILSILFPINYNESKINYIDLEKKIMAEFERFNEWQNKEGFIKKV